MEIAEASVPEYRASDCIAGHLRVEALLGEGGAGAVYRVRDERKGRRIALKQLRAPDGPQRALLTSQFAREFHTLCQLVHPRIIEVYDYGVDRGSPYYTMELLDGEDLHDRGKLPYRDACALLCDVASSLAILHSRGLIHRDLSARNVRCTSDGHAKLIDFGAMVPAGSAQRAIGTPPFIAPEVLQMQALDARADLYSLGALAYWMLTGRHAYPAQTLNQLRDAWRRPLRDLSDFAPDAPGQLVELVVSLLRFEREARPRTASEVMERLAAIAGLPADERPQVGRAYLVTPTLVGRDGALQEVRGSLLRAQQGGAGAALLIEGAPGVGRSRLLDECVLEAKLLGATVLRGAPAETAAGDYGVARALLAQLVELCPDLAEQTAQPRAPLLVHVSPELAPHVSPAPTPERRNLQAALRDFFLSIARAEHLVIAIDDLGAIDEPSAALLGALAHGASRRRLTLLLTNQGDDAQDQALTLLRRLAHRIELGPLDQAQTLALLRSLFGNGVRIPALAARLFPLARGRPRELMQLAEHLVSRRVARYEAGSWTLPDELSDDDLPKSDREVSARRIAGLGPDARELAEALALTDVRALSLAHFAELLEHRDPGRTFRGLDELLNAGILVPEADHYRLCASDALDPVRSGLAPDRLRALHARLSRALPREPSSAWRLIHMLRGDREIEAIEELVGGEPDERFPGRLDALITAAEAVARLRLPARTQAELHYRIARLSALMGRPDLFDQYGWPLIERLRQDSGLIDYQQQDPALEHPARLAQAFALAEKRQQARPEHERGLPPHESIMRLCALHGSALTISAAASDLERIARLGSLEPFAGLSPSIRLVQMAVDTQRALQQERYDNALRGCTEIVEQLDHADGLNPAAAAPMRLSHLTLLALLQASTADSGYSSRIGELDAQPGYRGNAWRHRMLYRLALGDTERASEYERRAELLDLQDSGGLTHPGLTTRAELRLHAMIGDLNGLKRATERAARLAVVFPRWRSVHAIGQALHALLQGDPAAALTFLAPALDATAAGQSVDWSLARETQLRILRAQGRVHEACELGMQYLDQAASARVTTDGLKRIMAEALAKAGVLEEAKRLAEEGIAALAARKVSGVQLGLAHEAHARVAIAMGDSAAFAIAAAACAEQYLCGRSPELRTRYDRLLRAAAEAGLAPTETPALDAEPALDAQAPEVRTVYSRMLTCISAPERAERALQLLLEETGARTGYLFGVRSGKLGLLYNPEPSEPAAALQEMLEDCLERERNGITPGPSPGSSSLRPQPIAAALGRFIDELGREFEPLLLAATHDGEAMIGGIAALHYTEDERPPLRKGVLEAVLESLVSSDVVDPVTCTA